MSDLDPKVVINIEEAFKELNETVKSLTPTFALIIEETIKNNKTLKDALDKRIKAEEEARKASNNSTKEELSQADKQKKLFQEEKTRREKRLTEYTEQIENYKQLSEKQKQTLIAIDKQLQRQRQLADIAKDPVQAFRDISNSSKSLGDVFRGTQEKLDDLTGNSKLAAGSLQLGTAALQGAAKAALSLADSLFKGERGASVDAKAFKAGVDPIIKTLYGIGTALSVLITLIPGVGIATKLMAVATTAAAAGLQTYTELQERGAKYNDALYDSFNKLSEAGLASAKGMTGIGDTMQRLGVASANIERFNQLLVGGSKDLALIGGIGSEGVEKFAGVAEKISHPASELNRKLMALGYTADDQREYTLKYIANETRAGRTQGKTQADLIKGATAYMEELDRIAELTGITRKEQQEARETVQKIDELRAAQELARQAGDLERVKELEAVEKFATRAMAEGRTKTALGAATAFAAGAGGVAVNPEAVAFLQKERAVEALRQGKSAEEVAELEAQDVKELIRKVGPAVRLGVKDLAGIGLADPLYKELDVLKRNQKAAEIAGDKSVTQYSKDLQAEKQKVSDQVLADNIKLRQEQEKAALTLDTVASKFNSAGGIMAKATEMFNKSVDALKGKGGGGAGPAGAGAGAAPAPTGPRVTETGGGAALVRPSTGVRGGGVATPAAAPATTPAAPTATPAAAPATPPAATTAAPVAVKSAATRTKPSIPPAAPQSEVDKAQAIVPSAEDALKLINFTGGSGSRDSFDKLNPSVKERFLALLSDPLWKGQKITVNSAVRSEDEQEALYKKWKDAGGGPDKPTAAGITTPALPVSMGGVLNSHNQGLGIDVGKDGLAKLEASGLLEKYGFRSGNTFRTPDPVHIQDIGYAPMKAPGNGNNIATNLKDSIPKAADGGIFTGPGFSSESNTTDLLKSIRQSLQTVQKKSVESELPQLSKLDSFDAKPVKRENKSAEILAKLTETIESKFNDLLEQVSKNNDIKEDILDYSRI